MHANDRQAIVAELRTFAAFAACSKDDLDALVAQAAEFAVPAHWSLLHQDIPAHSLYIIREGSATVFDGRREIASLAQGDVIGEMAFLTGSRRTATVSSITRLSGLRIGYRALHRLVTERPQLAEALWSVYDTRVAVAKAS